MLQLGEPKCTTVASNPDYVAYLISLLFHPCVKVPPTPIVSSSSSTLARRSAPCLRWRHRHTVGLCGEPLHSRPGVRATFMLCLTKPTPHWEVTAGARAALVDRLGGPGADLGFIHSAEPGADLPIEVGLYAVLDVRANAKGRPWSPAW
ncbi:uncharacterized protein J3R85_018991 [Psidium guajava]|nr:uncharacterized protein J3R85_018991 [Psidium guajava]